MLDISDKSKIIIEHRLTSPKSVSFGAFGNKKIGLIGCELSFTSCVGYPSQMMI